MSYGQELTKQYLTILTGLEPIENHRPEWLSGLEIDLFWPQLKLAVEFQGDQHYLPVFGQTQLLVQKRNDKSKVQMLQSRGIALIKLNAIDLEYTRIDGKLKRAGKSVRIPMRAVNPNKTELRRINKLATEYRKTLVKGFKAPSARARGASQRTAKREWLIENGFHVDSHYAIRLSKAQKIAKAKESIDALISAQPESGGLVLDKSMIAKYKTPNGGYNRETLEAIGISWPPFKRWKNKIRGIRISESQHQAALRASGRIASVD